MRTEPTAREALDEARRDILAAQEAAQHGDRHRRTQYARSAIDSAATTASSARMGDLSQLSGRRTLAESCFRRGVRRC